MPLMTVGRDFVFIENSNLYPARIQLGTEADTYTMFRHVNFGKRTSKVTMVSVRS